MIRTLKSALLVGTLALIAASVLGLAMGAIDLEGDIAAGYGTTLKGNYGQILLTAGQEVYVFYSPGTLYATSVLLPNDADANGFDSYIVQECKTVGGELWVGLFIGSDNSAWIPYSVVSGINPDYPFDPAKCD